VSASVWFPIASFATFSDDTSGTPEPSSVPSIRQNRTSAKCPITSPTPGVRNNIFSYRRRPASVRTARITATTTITTAAAASNP